MIKAIRLGDAAYIAVRCHLASAMTGTFLALYYLVCAIAVALDGLGVTILLGLLTGKIDARDNAVTGGALTILDWIGAGRSFSALFFLVAGLGLVRVVLHFTLQVCDGYMLAFLRRQFQNESFSSALRGDWEVIRDLRVGAFVGATTEESTIVVKYFSAAVRAVYYLVGAFILGLLSLLVSAPLTLMFALAAVPALAVFQFLFSYQSGLSRQQTVARQNFAADVNERFASLLQIKVTGNVEGQIAAGLRHQHEVVRLEVKLGYAQAAIGAAKMLMPVIGLLLFYAWSIWSGRDLADSFHLFAGVGAIGLRAVNHLDNLLSMLGVLSQSSGSLGPVRRLLSVRSEPVRQKIEEAVVGVRLHRASYTYPGGAAVIAVSGEASCGMPLLLRGASGAGKTTVANLIAGLYRPQDGNVEYLGASGRRYNSADWSLAIGYVTQDISLFHGSLRENILAFSPVSCSDDWVWSCLRAAGARDFAESMGGLDARIVESGRSLSGGQRRRLGIARVLVTRPQLLVLDEVTAGLDDTARAEVIETVAALALEVPTIIVSHDPDSFGAAKNVLVVKAARD